MSSSEDVATTRQKSAGGGETERGMNPGYRRRWREVGSVLRGGAINDDSPRGPETQEDEKSDLTVPHWDSNRGARKRFPFFWKKI